MKWIALHGNDVVGEFKNAKDAETYKAAADRAAFKVNIVSVDDDEFACYIRLVGLYGMPDHTAFYRKNGDCFDFCSDIAEAQSFSSKAKAWAAFRTIPERNIGYERWELVLRTAK